MAEKFVIKYFDMGQGDCILIVCPNGKLVVIDCGSSKGLPQDSPELLKVCTSIRKYTSQNKRKVNILILTHKDRDHYNQVKNIFLKRTFTDGSDDLHKISIGTVYFSSPPVPSNAYVLTQFTEGQCGQLITKPKFETEEIKQVFINDTEQKVLTYFKANNFQLADGVEQAITDHRLKIMTGTTPAGKTWSVSIIAGHVPETKKPKSATDRVDPTNALSLVTLLKFGSTRALFLGDGTKATETFLLANHRTLIKNCEFVHIPHHGSETSSSQSFVSVVNPKGAEVTHEPFETGNRLPRKVVLDRWLKTLKEKDTMDSHVIDYWKPIEEDDYTKILANWKTKGWPIEKQNFATYLSRIPKGLKNNYIAVYKALTEFWGLYRTKTELNLCGTGADDYNTWDFPVANA